jgi:hypothetical protein
MVSNCSSVGGVFYPLFSGVDSAGEFILALRKKGYYIDSITTDIYESAYFRQDMSHQGIKTHVLSVDKTSEHYRTLRSLVYRGLILLPKSKLLQRELEELELSPDGRKVDHPEKHPDVTPGSKDVADACCGAVWNALDRGMKGPWYLIPPSSPPPPPCARPRPPDDILDMFWGDEWRGKVN